MPLYLADVHGDENVHAHANSHRDETVCGHAELVSWAQSKGLTQLTPGMLLEPSFADGRLLCRLVELLTRCTLAGIEWHTPSIAASRHNIAKVCCLPAGEQKNAFEKMSLPCVCVP